MLIQPCLTLTVPRLDMECLWALGVRIHTPLYTQHGAFKKKKSHLLIEKGGKTTLMWLVSYPSPANPHTQLSQSETLFIHTKGKRGKQIINES